MIQWVSLTSQLAKPPFEKLDAVLWAIGALDDLGDWAKELKDSMRCKADELVGRLNSMNELFKDFDPDYCSSKVWTDQAEPCDPSGSGRTIEWTDMREKHILYVGPGAWSGVEGKTSPSTSAST